MLVTGVQMLSVAKRNGFAVPAFNISDYGMLRECIRTAEDVGSPVILSIHPAEWALVGDEFMLSVLALAGNATVPVCVQLDHGATLEQVVGAIRLGFTAVMIDGSLLDYAENVALTRKVVEFAHAVGVSVEAEIGTIGERDPSSAAAFEAIQYTEPAEALQFCQDTGIDYLAVAVGTCHGVYPKGVAPDLKLDLISEISELVGLPLVLHGGSGALDDQVTAAVGRGVAKLNISADMKTAYFTRVREVLADPAEREPHDIYPPALTRVRELVAHKMAVTKSVGTAGLYTAEVLAASAPGSVGEQVLLGF